MTGLYLKYDREVIDTTPRTGRPKLPDPKDRYTQIRLTDEEMDMLDRICKYYQTTKSEWIREQIRKQYAELLVPG